MVRIKHSFKRWRIDEAAYSEFNFESDEDDTDEADAAVELPARKMPTADALQQNGFNGADGDLLQSAAKRARDVRNREMQGQKKPRLESKMQDMLHNKLRFSDESEVKPWGSWLGKQDHLLKLNKKQAPSPVSRLSANVMEKRKGLRRENEVDPNAPVFKRRDIERPKLIVMRGDPKDWSTGAIVTDTNSLLHHKFGLAATIIRKGGWEIQRQSLEWVFCNGEFPVGSAMWTTAGNLSSKFIIYTVGPDVSLYRWPIPRHQLELRCAVRSALNIADSLGVSSVAVPALCTGVCRYPKYLAAREIVTECLEFCDEFPATSLRLIVLMNEDEVTTSIFVQALKDTKQKRQLERQQANVATMG